MIAVAVFVYVLITLPTALYSASWTGDLTNGQSRYACRGSSFTLPWKLILDPLETLEDIQWYFHGRSEELVGTYVHGSFFTSPAFSGRVQYSSNASLTFNVLTPGDSGNYSVTATVLKARSYEKLTSTVIVDVRDQLLTSDGRIHIRENPSAVTDPDTGKVAIELLCGDFNYLGQPPFPVDWVNPDGQILQSTSFKNNYYTLLLHDPVKRGNYSCRITTQYYVDACLQGPDASKAAQDSLILDDSTARIKILEAEKTALQLEIEQLRTLPTSGGSGNANNPSNSVHLAFFADMRNVISTDDGHRVMHEGDVFVFNNVPVNDGDAYNNVTGIFTTPIPGTYYFSTLVSSWTHASGQHSTGFCFHVDGAPHDGKLQCVWSPLEVATSNFQRQLGSGDRVWVEANTGGVGSAIYNAKLAQFSGFLLQPDM